MKLQRTKNAGRNIVFGGILKTYQIIVPFLLRTVMIYYLGIEYVGLNSLFTSILQVLNLTELGVGSALVFSMYKPIANNDDVTICALMQLYKKYYRIIGTVILIAGIVITPFLPQLIKGDIPDGMNIYILFYLNLAATILTYWLFSYKNSILMAHQRTDVSSKVGLWVSTLEYILEFAALIFLHNYYLYLVAKILTQIIQNLMISLFAERIFPQYRAKGSLAPEVVRAINQKVKDVFTAKVGGVIVNSADSIVVSAFLGLSVLAVYNNYYYILTSIIGFLTIGFNACIAGIGNSLETESIEKNYHDFKAFTLIVVWVSGICTCCLLCLYQPFMLWWLKDTRALFGIKEVVCLCAYFFVYEIVSIMIQYKDAAGMWHEDRFRPLITAGSNLIMNLATVRFLGIVGVLLSTAVSFAFIGIPWLIRNIFAVIFRRSPMEYVGRLLLYAAVTVIACAACFGLCQLVPWQGIGGLIVRGIICGIVSNAIFFVGYFRLQEFARAKSVFVKVIKRK